MSCVSSTGQVTYNKGGVKGLRSISFWPGYGSKISPEKMDPDPGQNHYWLTSVRRIFK